MMVWTPLQSLVDKPSGLSRVPRKTRPGRYSRQLQASMSPFDELVADPCFCYSMVKRVQEV